MPRGFHYGRTQFRQYIDRRLVFNAVDMKPLYHCNNSASGNIIQGEKTRIDFHLVDSEEWGRVAVLNCNGVKTPIPITKIDLPFGERFYLICPCCQERRNTLYLTRRNQVICRKCARLHYVSQSRSPLARLELKIRKKRKELWGRDKSAYYSIADLMESCEYFPKPKWKRSHTFEYEIIELAKLEKEYWDRVRNTDMGYFVM